MVTITCEKTGVQFEAATKRAKSHPQIMGAINEAYKEGWYGQALEAIKAGREQGLTDVQDFLTLLEETRQAALKQQSIDYRAVIDRKFAARDARRERAILNAKLERHGYRWSNVGFADEEEADAFDINAPIGPSWVLISADNRTVSLQQALAEIEAK